MKTLLKKLAAFEQECPTIHKGSKGYGYTYSSLAEILNVINPLMKKHDLGFYQGVDDNQLLTVVFETTTGESIQCKATIPQDVALKGMNEFQVLGSAITYMRRYQLSAMLGLVTDKDIDAAGVQEKAKENLTPEHPKWAAAKENLAKGKVTLDAINKHYNVSPQNIKKLKDEN